MWPLHPDLHRVAPYLDSVVGADILLPGGVAAPPHPERRKAGKGVRLGVTYRRSSVVIVDAGFTWALNSFGGAYPFEVGSPRPVN